MSDRDAITDEAMKTKILYTVPTRRNLKGRSAQELQMLCCALHIPRSGNRAKVSQRILDTWAVRSTLKDKSIDDLKAAFKAKQLKAMCKTVGAYAGGNKRSMAASLLNWRNECRRKGQEYVNALRARRVIAEILILGVWGPM